MVLIDLAYGCDLFNRDVYDLLVLIFHLENTARYLERFAPKALS